MRNHRISPLRSFLSLSNSVSVSSGIEYTDAEIAVIVRSDTMAFKLSDTFSKGRHRIENTTQRH